MFINNFFFKVALLLFGGIYFIFKTKKRILKRAAIQESKQSLVIDENESNRNLPQLHKQYQRYSTVESLKLSGQERYYIEDDVPNDYVVIASDTITLNEDNTPPHAFSYDHLVIPSAVLYKPNQVNDQLTFIETQQQQQQSSIGSFILQSTATNSTNTAAAVVNTITPDSNNNINYSFNSIVKPSV